MSEQLKALVEEWVSLHKDYQECDGSHKEYMEKLEAVEQMQKSGTRRLRDVDKRLAAFKRSLKLLERAELNIPERQEYLSLLNQAAEYKTAVGSMLEELPKHDNGPYLNLILGTNTPLSLLRKEDKFRYKDEYEKFKLNVQIVAFAVAAVAIFCSLRAVDAIFHFLLVWYYCTLTIRESILRHNGSRIKGWWVAHHYLSTVLAGISLTWPDGECYQSFRLQFLCFSLYLSVVQWLQVQYQRGILYRLRSLGQGHDMNITVDGFQTYMFKGLSFILPFLFVAYAIQVYNAFRLFYIYKTKECEEWQVIALGVLFLVLAVGNSLTTGAVVLKKYADKVVSPSLRRRLLNKYSTTTAPNTPRKQE